PRLTVVPDLEVGVGNNETTIAISGDFLYHFVLKNSNWTPYAGAGPCIAFESDGGSETDAGLNLVGGMSVPTKSSNRFFVEIKRGLGDIPSFKAIAGWAFPM